MIHTPGTLVRARGREWVVLPESAADFLVLRPLGGSDDEVAGVPLALETVVPATFAPPDPSLPGDAQSCRLLRDALRLGFRSGAGPFRSFGRIQVEPRPYQLVPLLMALRLDPVRLLIADDVGIGKTIEACLIARELLDRGEISRFTVLCPPHLAEQWQRELASKFQLAAELVLPGTAARLERGLPQFRSLFEEYPYTAVSLDYVKSKTRRESFLRAAPELVIVDEAHTCADTPDAGTGRHLRHDLLRALAADPDRHLILVTATPHSGKEEAFRSLLALLDPSFSDLPADLDRAQHESTVRRLARHVVQRRRHDIAAYLAEDTPFPTRLEREESYGLTPAWSALYDELLAYAEETVGDQSGSLFHQRLRWWSVLALLRAVASSPAAAAATLRNRARKLDADAPGPDADPDSVAAVDERGRATVLDLTDQEPTDVVPLCDLDDVDDDEATGTAAAPAPHLARERRRLRNFANRAAALAGNADPKLAGLVPILERLLADGHRPIVFCRFIPTVHYLVDELRRRLGKKVEIRGVTGELPPADREQRVAELIDQSAGRRLLVATDCLSEGINLQAGFDAVVHYDLAWNPTRHEQREGRVDRYGQPRREVRVVTYYGRDNGIDGLVLEVLIRKHQKIRSSLGISVPVPVDGEAVLTAVVQGALLRRRNRPAEQLRLPLDLHQGELTDLDRDWQNAAERETASRGRFAQHALRPDEVAPELAAARDALGGPPDIRRFVVDTVRRHGGAVAGDADDPNAVLTLDLRELPASLRERLATERGPTDRGDEALLAGLRVATAPANPGTDASAAGRLAPADPLHRTHPLVTGLASWLLDRALADPAAASAKRCGVLRTRRVTSRTVLLLLRLRHRLATRSRAGVASDQLLEEATLAAFTGSPESPAWLDDAATAALLTAEPDANIAPGQASHLLTALLAELPALAAFGAGLDALAHRHAAAALAAHARVRRAGGSARGPQSPTQSHTQIHPQLPVDVLGVYLFLPVVGTPGHGGGR